MWFMTLKPSTMTLIYLQRMFISARNNAQLRITVIFRERFYAKFLSGSGLILGHLYRRYH